MCDPWTHIIGIDPSITVLQAERSGDCARDEIVVTSCPAAHTAEQPSVRKDG